MSILKFAKREPFKPYNDLGKANRFARGAFQEYQSAYDTLVVAR